MGGIVSEATTGLSYLLTKIPPGFLVVEAPSTSSTDSTVRAQPMTKNAASEIVDKIEELIAEKPGAESQGN